MRLRKNFMPKPSTIIKKGIHQAIWGGHDLDRCGEKYFGYKKDKKGALGCLGGSHQARLTRNANT